MPMDSTPPNRDDALSKVLLLAGLALVAGAIAVYHYSPQFKLGTKPAPASDSVAGQPRQAEAPPSIRGEPAPALDVPDLNGKKVHLADFKGKVVLVNFWATWCAPCLLEIPWFIEFQKQYGPQGFEVVAISMDEEGPKVVKPFVEKHGMQPFRVVMGNDSIPPLFGGIPGLPVTFLVDRKGNLYSRHLGLAPKDDVEDEIQILLRDSSSAPPAAASSSNSSQPAAAGPASRS
jgi:thiol-disulfide isomerase/thioredoxin